MTLYARSDVRGLNNPDCPNGPHQAAEDDEHFVLDCPVCEPIARRVKALYSADEFNIPMTPAEARAKRKAEEDDARRIAAVQVAREKMLFELADADERGAAEKAATPAKAARTRKAAAV